MKNIFNNKSINKLNFLSISFATMLLMIFIFIVIYNSYIQYQHDIKLLEFKYIKSQKKFIKQETNMVLSFIKYKHKKFNNVSLVQLQDEIVDIIEHMRNERDGTGYIFIYTFDGINIADPILKENNGKNLINFQDINGKKVIQELITISQKPNGGYVNYVWNKPITNTLEKKISYSISYKPWRWMIGCGVYLDNIQNVIDKREKEYQEKVIKYLYQVIILSIILFIMGYLLNKYLTSKLEESEQLKHDLLKQQDKFIKNAIHEINTPLSNILINIELIKELHPSVNKLEEFKKILHSKIDQLSILI